MGLALDEFVNKGVSAAISDAVGQKLKSSQRKLIQKSAGIETSKELKEVSLGCNHADSSREM